MSRLLTTAQVADMTGISAATLRWWRHIGSTGPASFVLGKKAVRYREEDVTAWLVNQYETTKVGA